MPVDANNVRPGRSSRREAGRSLRVPVRQFRAASGGAWALAAALGAHREALFAAGLLLATLVAIYARLIFQGLVLAGYDVQTYFYPYWASTFEALRSGRVPLWNPHLFMGAPFLANPQAAVFYPPNWPLLVLEPERALALAVMLHVALAAAGALALARRALGLSWPAATTTAAVFAFGGFFAGQLGHINQISVVAWLPWLLLALDRSLRGSRRWWVVAPVVSALMLLAGHPQQAYIGFSFALLYALVVGVHRARGGGGRFAWARAVGRALASWVLVVTGGVLLAAVQLLPTLELSRLSIRSDALSLADAASFSLPPEEVLLGLLPTFVRMPSSTEFVAYVGVSGIVLAALAVAARAREPRVWLFAVAGIVAIVLALGPSTPMFAQAHRLLPGFDLFRVPARWMLVTVLGGAVLAGYGTDALASRAQASGRRLLGPLSRWFAVVSILALVALIVAATQPPLPAGVRPAWLIAFALALIVLGVAFLGRSARWRWLAPALVAAELGFASVPSAAREPVPDSVYRPVGDVLPVVMERASAGRVLSLAEPSFEIAQPTRAALAERWREALGDRSWREFLVARKQRDIIAPNLAMAYGISTSDGYDGGVLPLRNYVRLRDALFPGSAECPDALLQNQVTSVPVGRVLDTMSVDRVIQNRVMVLEFAGADMDLRFPLRVDEPVEIDGLRVPRVVGLMVLVNGDPNGRGSDAGAVDVWDDAGRNMHLPLVRSADHPQRVSVGPGHLVSARPGLPQPAFLSTARFDLPLEAHRLAVTPRGGGFELRGLTLLLADGSSRAVVLRPDDPGTVRVEGDVTVLRRASGSSRVWLPARVQIVSGPEAAQTGVARSQFHPASEAWLQSVTTGAKPASLVPDFLRDIGIAGPRSEAGRLTDAQAADLRDSVAAAGRQIEFSGVAAARLVSDEPERVVVDVETDGPRLLVLADTFYPGWEARVDGRPAPIWEANVAHRAVLIAERGRHTVEFTYRSMPFEAGRAVSVGSVVVGLVALAVMRYRRERVG